MFKELFSVLMRRLKKTHVVLDTKDIGNVTQPMCMSNELQKTLDSLQESGMVIIGREFIEVLVANDPRRPVELISALMTQGRSRGVHFYQDQAKFNFIELCRKLGELGFDKDTAQVIVANLRPVPAPELLSLGDRD